jgi:hypothetical protein
LPAIAPLVSGFLVDADHMLDHQLYHHAPPGEAEVARQRMILALHGWEYLALLAAVEPRALRGRASTDHGLTLGYLFHLAIDQLSNEVEHPLTYLVLYRASRGFSGRFFAPNEQSHAWRLEKASRLWKWL